MPARHPHEMPSIAGENNEDAMATKQDGRIVETATEARQAEPGPSVLVLLTISTVCAAVLMAGVWFFFFRT